MAGNVARGILAAVVLSVAATPALAREDYCLNANGSLNKQATEGYRKFDKKRSEKLMRQIHGTWYNRTTNPGTGQISDLWQTFLGKGAQAGLYSYFNRVCSGGFCSEYNGVGMWTVQGNKNDFRGFFIVSDSSRDHYCGVIARSQLSNGNNRWSLESGAVLQRTAN